MIRKRKAPGSKGSHRENPMPRSATEAILGTVSVKNWKNSRGLDVV